MTTRTRILVVEDSPTQAEALRAHLEEGGYAVVVADRGEAALQMLEEDGFDLLLSDIVMPGAVDGYELCQRVKALAHRDLPVILLTSLSDPMDIIRGLECGADNFLTKPYEPEALLERIGSLLENRRRRSRERLQTGVSVLFMGREFVITSEREQILDLLVTTFEQAVHQNRELRKREEELTVARAELTRYAGSLEGMLQSILDHSPAAIYVKDREGRYRFINRQFESLFDVRRDDVIGTTGQDCLPPEVVSAVHANDRQVLEAGRAVQLDEELPAADGRRVYLSVKFPLYDASGRIDAVCGISTDITERERAEAALKARARQQAAVAELGRLGLTQSDLPRLMDDAAAFVARTLDVEYCAILELRGEGRELLLRAGLGWKEGYVGRAAVGPGSDSQAGYTLSVRESVIVEDLTRERRFRVPELLQAHGVVSGLTVAIPGQRHPYGVLGAHTARRRVFSADDANFLGAVANVLAAAIERDRSEHAMRRSQRLEAVGRLAGGIAHDFNNLLTAISGYSELVLAELVDQDPLAEDVREIRKAAERGSGLTRQLLAFSRRQVLQPTVLSLNDVIADLEPMLRRLIGEDIELRIAPDPSLRHVLADPGQIEQVILNLVVNARDAMPTGGRLVLETANVELDEGLVAGQITVEPGLYAMLAVSDTGTGMDEATREQIFEPFFTTKEPDKGTGLGLATVFGIVKQSGGDISVYSEPGRGTTFKIYLPRSDQEVAARPPADTVAPLRGGTETVLLVEDEEAVRQLVARILRRTGYEVLVGATAEEGLMLSERHAGSIHLLVSDVVMPRMSGPDLATRLKESRPDLRLLFLSGYTAPAMAQHELLGSDVPLLSKPFTAEALTRRVREILDC